LRSLWRTAGLEVILLPLGCESNEFAADGKYVAAYGANGTNGSARFASRARSSLYGGGLQPAAAGTWRVRPTHLPVTQDNATTTRPGDLAPSGCAFARGSGGGIARAW